MKTVTYRMPADLYEAMNLISETTGISIAALIFIALWHKLANIRL